MSVAVAEPSRSRTDPRLPNQLLAKRRAATFASTRPLESSAIPFGSSVLTAFVPTFGYSSPRGWTAHGDPSWPVVALLPIERPEAAQDDQGRAYIASCNGLLHGIESELGDRHQARVDPGTLVLLMAAVLVRESRIIHPAVGRRSRDTSATRSSSDARSGEESGQQLLATRIDAFSCFNLFHDVSPAEAKCRRNLAPGRRLVF